MATGGVGEAMLISAITGAGTSAVTGGDPLKGALLGAATGGIGAGVAGGASGAANAATNIGAQTATETGANLAAQGSQMVQLPSTVPGVAGDVSYGSALRGGIPEGATNFGVERFGTPFYDNLASNSATAANAASQAATTPPTALEAFYAKNPIAMPAGLGALGSVIGDRPRTEMPDDEYSGALSRFHYDPDKYRRAASGGLMDTMTAKRMAAGGHLGSYSDGGRLLKGPGDGMSDDIPASIEGSQPALLADGEFVVPADVVSGIGNGSTDAGARELYAMMERVRKARTGTGKQAPEIDSSEMMPA